MNTRSDSETSLLVMLNLNFGRCMSSTTKSCTGILTMPTFFILTLFPLKSGTARVMSYLRLSFGTTSRRNLVTPSHLGRNVSDAMRSFFFAILFPSPYLIKNLSISCVGPEAVLYGPPVDAPEQGYHRHPLALKAPQGLRFLVECPAYVNVKLRKVPLLGLERSPHIKRVDLSCILNLLAELKDKLIHGSMVRHRVVSCMSEYLCRPVLLYDPVDPVVDVPLPDVLKELAFLHSEEYCLFGPYYPACLLALLHPHLDGHFLLEPWVAPLAIRKYDNDYPLSLLRVFCKRASNSEYLVIRVRAQYKHRF